MVLLPLIGCTTLTEPPADWGVPMSKNAVTDAAYEKIVACAKGRPLVRVYEGLRFYTVPGGSFDLDWHTSMGYDLPVSGFTYFEKIYVAEARKDLVNLWAHELGHSLFGLKGTTLTNHDPLFSKCGLLII